MVSIAVLSMTHHRLTTQSSLQAGMELVDCEPCGLLQDQADGQFACRTCRSGVQWLQPVPVRAGTERTLPERSENSQSLRGGQKWALGVR
jgi:hypothetical protein